MILFDAALCEVTGETEILLALSARWAMIVWTWSAHHWHNQVTYLAAGDRFRNLDYFTQRLVAQDKVITTFGGVPY